MECFFCGSNTALPPGRRDTCTNCGRDLHACFQCRFYDKNAHHECREPNAEWVRDKESSNFCEYFEMGRKRNAGDSASTDNAKSRLETLFKKR